MRQGYFSVFKQRKPTRPARRSRGRAARVEPVEDKVRYLTNRGVPAPLIEKLRPLAHIGRRRDLEWLARRITAQVAAAPLPVAREVENAMLAKAEAVLDWIVTARPNYLGLAFDEAEAESEAWHDKRSKAPTSVKRRDLISKLGRNVVYDFGDGWAWVKVPLDEYRTEGQIMGFSLSSVYKAYEAYSLRGPDNAPHVTLTVRPPPKGSRRWRLKEVKGKSNARPPAPQYSRRTVTWLLTRPFGGLGVLTATGVGDLGRIIAAVIPGETAQTQAARRIFSRRAVMLWAKEFREGSPEFPVPPATLPELVAAMTKTKSFFTFAALADAMNARIDQLTQVVAGGRSAGVTAPARQELRTLDNPRFQHNLRRRARSKKVRDRLLAAALLPQEDLHLLVGEPDDKVLRVAVLRLDALVADVCEGRAEGSLDELESIRDGLTDPQMDEADVVALATRLLPPEKLDVWVSQCVTSNPGLAETWVSDYPELIPGILLKAPMDVKIELLLKSKRLPQITGVGRSIVSALDSVAREARYGEGGGGDWYGFGTHPRAIRLSIATALGLHKSGGRIFAKRLKPNMLRRAKSPRVRDRLLAAMLLAPKDLLLLAGDPNPRVEVMASLRIHPTAAEAFFARAKTLTAKTGALIRMPKAAFQRHVVWHGDRQLVYASLVRAVELGVPYELDAFWQECDEIQFAIGVVPDRDDVRALTEQFARAWHSPPGWWAPGGGHEDPRPWGVEESSREATVAELQGGVEQMLASEALVKMVQFAPSAAAELGVFGCDDYLDAPVYAWGHPADAQDLLDAELFWCGEEEAEVDVPGWAEATYFLSRIAGSNPATALRRSIASLNMFEDALARLEAQVEGPEAAERMFDQLEKKWLAFDRGMRAA